MGVGGLTANERSAFDRLGYVVKGSVFTAADLASLRAALEQIVAEQAERLAAAGKLDETYSEAGFERRLALIWEHNADAGAAIAQVITGKHGGGYDGAPILAMIRHEPLLDCIRELVGSSIIGSSVYRIRPKVSGVPRGEVPWHQDSGYLLAHCDRHLIVTCWIPLVDATVANGCLYVIPGAHRNGILRHYTEGSNGYLEVLAEELPGTQPVPVPMAAGDALLMTNLTPHASFANSTDVVRWSIDLRYQGAEVPNNVDEDPVTYVPEREPVTMACYPPEADFVIRDPTAPEREVATAAQFHRARARYEQAKPFAPGRGWVSHPSRRGSGPAQADC